MVKDLPVARILTIIYTLGIVSYYWQACTKSRGSSVIKISVMRISCLQTAEANFDDAYLIFAYVSVWVTRNLLTRSLWTDPREREEVGEGVEEVKR